MDTVIKNGKIVSPAGITSGAIGIDAGKIVAVVSSESLLPAPGRTIDANGNYILPGVCDMHYHQDFPPSPPFAPWPQISRTESSAGALGGVTTMGFYLMPPADKVVAETFEGFKSDWENNALNDCIFHMLITSQQRMDEISTDMSDYGIAGFKFLLGYKGAQAAAAGSAGTDDAFIFDGFQRISRLRDEGWPALAMVHAENPDIINLLRKRVEHRNDPRAWSDSRPYFVEAEAISRMIYLAGIAECPLYIVHTTIGDGVDIIAKAKYHGKDIVCETCPQYLTHNYDSPTDLMKEKPAFTVFNPPLRSREDNERLWQGIKDGTISVVGSDSQPTSFALKDAPDIWKGFVPMGAGSTSAQILPVLLSEGVNKRGLSLERVVEVTSYNPARTFGIYPQKGTISVGSDADILIVDLNKEVTWRAEMSPSNADYSTYEGWTFKGWPILTMLRGEVIVSDGKIIGNSGIGRYVPRSRK